MLWQVQEASRDVLQTPCQAGTSCLVVDMHTYLGEGSARSRVGGACAGACVRCNAGDISNVNVTAGGLYEFNQENLSTGYSVRKEDALPCQVADALSSPGPQHWLVRKIITPCTCCHRPVPTVEALHIQLLHYCTSSSTHSCTGAIRPLPIWIASSVDRARVTSGTARKRLQTGRRQRPPKAVHVLHHGCYGKKCG
jgi:hypothetical protein